VGTIFERNTMFTMQHLQLDLTAIIDKWKKTPFIGNLVNVSESLDDERSCKLIIIKKACHKE